MSTNDLTIGNGERTFADNRRHGKDNSYLSSYVRPQPHAKGRDAGL